MRSEETTEFEVLIEQTDEDTLIVTQAEPSAMEQSMLKSALAEYDSKNSQYSAYLLDSGSNSNDVTVDLLDSLADSPQTDLKKTLDINSLVRKEINKNDLIGITVTSIDNNVNTDFSVRYKNPPKRNAKKTEKVEMLIDDFNEQINVKRLIRNVIPTTYAEGTYLMYLRSDKERYVVDYYPLGVAIISDYEVDGEPVLLIDIKELTKRLKKTMIKKKNNKPFFFDSVEKEIKANYPKEVYDAYKGNENYAKLDVRYSGVIRIGHLNRKYGLTPIFRALQPTMMLYTFEDADRVNTKAKAKKIIHQTLNEKLMGENGEKNGFGEMAYAHQNLMNAWSRSTVVVTTPAYVKNIAYVESKAELTNVDLINQYRNRVMTCLGIGFLSQDGKQSVSTANISVDQLMLTINKISEQLEHTISKWYRVLLEENKFDLAYSPRIKVMEAQQMSFDMRKALADLLYSRIGASYKTTFEVLGMDVEDEALRREKENEQSYDDIFSPHATSYTITDSADQENPEGNVGGRPPAEKQNDKQVYDQNRE